MFIDAEHIAAYENSLTLRGRSSRTAAKYSTTVSAFLRESGQVDETRLGTAWAEWINAARRTMAAGTIRLRLTVGKSFCDFMQAAQGPLSDYKRPPLPEPVPHPLPGGVADVRLMADKAATEQAMFAVILGGLAGLRVSETISITRDDVLSTGELRVKGKGEKERRIPISSELARYVDKMPAEGRLVPMSNAGARKAITVAAERAGIAGPEGEGVSSHDLRATFGTAVYDKTKDIVLVQRLLGHSDVKTTQVYIGANAQSTREAVEF
ncbi:XerC-like tyrosine recombinase [Rhodococcus phage Mbo2]|uniref:Integrase n=1 Tax=Rhodococcus phage Mbo2 TaxID=2936911 RepID=A0A9E7L9X9_9CAUD|nr:XerC-like tyrosine recombinase [Rhodococcus phage Mbo2]